MTRVVSMWLLALLIIFGGARAAGVEEAREEPATGVTVLAGLSVRFQIAPPDARGLGGTLLDAFDVSAKGRYLVGVEDEDGGRNLIIPEAGVKLLTKDDAELETFCRLPDGSLIAIRNGHLARFDGERLVDEVRLPSPRMRLACGSGADRFYLFGGEGETARFVFEVQEGRRYRKLIEAPGAVGALVSVGRRLYIAVGATVIGFGEDGPATVVYQGPEGSPAITSLAADAAGGILYLSTADGVTAVAGGRAVGLLAGCGGRLIFRDGSLHVLDAGRGLLLVLEDIARDLEGGDER